MRNDDAYNNRDHVPNVEVFLEAWPEDARAYRETEAALGRARLNEAYGPHEREKLDVFHPAGKPEGLLVFVHGGYWRAFSRMESSHLAAGATARGWAVAVPSYPLAPEVRIPEITRCVAKAITHAAGLVAGPIVLAGHSAGGHLVARMVCADVLDASVEGRVTGVMPISPVSDLRPLLETSMNEDFRLDEASAVAESPALMTPTLDVPVHVWVGADERPAFLDQAKWLHDAWAGSELTVAAAKHHFNVIEPLTDPESPMVNWLVSAT
ncbi:MAG: alpha/beta hydrolase [Pseudomonadota bacterium]